MESESGFAIYRLHDLSKSIPLSELYLPNGGGDFYFTTLLPFQGAKPCLAAWQVGHTAGDDPAAPF